MSTIKQMVHQDYQRRVRGMSVPELMYVIADAREAIQANPDSPNNGFYQDEIHYCAGELRRRQGVRQCS